MAIHPFEKYTLPERGIDLGLGSDCHVRYRITREEFEAFIAALKADSTLTLLQEHQLDQNATVSFLSDEAHVCVTFTAKGGILRVMRDSTKLFAPLPLQPQPTENKTAPLLGISPLDYTHREITDGNGMGYVLTLPDGRYLVYDGGYRIDAPALYRFLKEHNKRDGDVPVIAAWIFTHSHADHYGAFRALAESHADQLVIEAAIFNPVLPEMLPRGNGYNPYLTEELRSDLSRFGHVKCYRPHTGQVLYFGETPLEILYTHEHYLPGTMPFMNDSSIVSRITLCGQTILFMADCERTTSDLLCELYDNALQSDVVQVNHHGYSGGTTELYQKIAPKFALWPTNDTTFSLRVTGVKYPFIGNALNSNKYLFDTLGRARCLTSDRVTVYSLPLT